MNIVFDLGKVVIEWDPRHLYRKIFANEEQMEWFLAEVCHGEWNLEQDRGRSFSEGVKEAIGRHPKHAREIALYHERWMEMVPGAIGGTVAIIEELQGRDVPLYAITNWNSEKFRETQKRFPVLDSFRDIVVSGEVGLIKPDPRIYRLFLERNRLAAGQCLFIDDSERNVAGARAIGMRAHHFKSPDVLREAMAGEGVL